jgi:nitronate monooxygenase
VQVVSFFWGEASALVDEAHEAGASVFVTVGTAEEGRAAVAAGADVIVAQGWEAGGHRGMFDPEAEDSRLGTLALTRLLVLRSGLPVIAAGGIMDGRGIRAALNLGAVAAQLGTAFITCPESTADAGYRAALGSDAGQHTTMTRAVSGRPARCVRNRFTEWGAQTTAVIPDYPVAYDAGKALNAAAKATGEFGFGAQWAGQGAPLARSLPAADLIAVLVAEMEA